MMNLQMKILYVKLKQIHNNKVEKIINYYKCIELIYFIDKIIQEQ